MESVQTKNSMAHKKMMKYAMYVMAAFPILMLIYEIS